MAQSNAHYLVRIQRQQRLLPSIILHFDPALRDLGAWFWPITQSGVRVAPSNILEYRALHDFKAPCCLCADRTVGGQYIESAIYVALDGFYAGEYVAGCASDRCGYLVNMERMYTRRGLLIEKYPLREPGFPAPPPVWHLPNRRQHDGQLPSIQTHQPPVRGPDTLISLLKLDSWVKPGLPEADFAKLFAKCRCGLIMTHRVFKDHTCAVAPVPLVIDLTLDDSDKSTEQSDGFPIIIDLTRDSDDN